MDNADDDVKTGFFEGVLQAPSYANRLEEAVRKHQACADLGMRAMSVYNGVAGVAQMFGYPLPKVPKDFREGAQKSVESLKQESSVEAFGSIHQKVKNKDQEEETVRGASLRELQKFFDDHPESKSWAGLRRTYADDGSALWTCVPDDQVEQELGERVKRRKEYAKEEDAEKQKSILTDIEKKVNELNDKKCCVVA